MQTEIKYWVPGGTIVYVGTPKTRVEWLRLTWRGYLAYWWMAGRIIYLMAKHRLKL